MHSDPERNYRNTFLEASFEFTDRVDSPWQAVPDLPAHNGKIFRRLRLLLQRMDKQREKGQSPNSRGVLILGEAGMGKTHLLMRLTQTFAATYHMIFIRKPNNEDAVARHVWSNMLESLTKSVPSQYGGEWSQFDALLSRVLSRVVILELQSDIEAGKGGAQIERWIQQLERHPDKLSQMLGSGEQRGKNIRLLRRKAMGYFSSHHPDIELNIANALIYYYFSDDPHEKRLVFLWLKGQELPEDDAKGLGIPQSWVDIAPETTRHGVLQYKEEKALQAIRTLGILSTYYHPLVLAFDQLEGLRNDAKLTRRWGDTMREIFTMTPNLMVLTCVFPSLWESWFLEQLDTSTTERIASRKEALEPLTAESARAMLMAHLEGVCRELELPPAPFPFTEEDVTRLYQPGMTPRAFLQRASERLDNWLFEDEDEEGDEALADPGMAFSSPQNTEAEGSFVLDSFPSFEEAEEAEEAEDTEDTEDAEDAQGDGPMLVSVPFSDGPSAAPEVLHDAGVSAETFDDASEQKAQAEVPSEAESSTPKASEVTRPVVSGAAREEQLHKHLSRRLHALREIHNKRFLEWAPDEEDAFGRIRTLTRFLRDHMGAPAELSSGDEYDKVTPSHFLLWHRDVSFDDAEGLLCCVAMCNGYGIALANRVRNISDYYSDVLFTRDSRCKPPGQKTKRRLEELESESGLYVPLNGIEYSHIYAIYDVLTELEQQDLCLDDDSPVEPQELFAFLTREDFLFQSGILRFLHERLHDAMPASPIDGGPGGEGGDEPGPEAPLDDSDPSGDREEGDESGDPSGMTQAEAVAEAGLGEPVEAQSRSEAEVAGGEESSDEAPAPPAIPVFAAPASPAIPVFAEPTPEPIWRVRESAEEDAAEEDVPVEEAIEARPTSFARRSLRLPFAPAVYLEEAATAVAEEFAVASQCLRLSCEQVEAVPGIEGLYALQLDALRVPRAGWRWEGAVAFLPEQLDLLEYEQLSETDGPVMWRGEVLQVNTTTGHLFVYVEDGRNIPQPGPFLLRPFAFLAHLQEIYSGTRWQTLRGVLPPLLQACLKGASPEVAEAAGIAQATEPFKDLWPYSWEILWGPPGTGKTTAISKQVVAALRDPSERILVLSTTNRATDEVALRIGEQLQLAAASYDELPVRVGKGADYNRFRERGLEGVVEASGADILRQLGELDAQQRRVGRSLALQVERNKLQKRLYSESLSAFLDSARRVVVTTVFNAGSMLIRDDLIALLEEGRAPFTTLILDEAGVVSRSTTAALGVLASRRVVLAGDPMQLSPISRIARVLPSHKARWRGESALGHLVGSSLPTRGSHMLSLQYRMHPTIRAAISRYRYQDQLKDAAAVTSRPSQLPAKLKGHAEAIWYVLDKDAPSRPKIRAERGPGQRSWQRPYSFELLDRIVPYHPEWQHVTGLFLTPFVAQVQAASKWLPRAGLGSWQAATVHSQQGAEADVVIFDTVHAGSHGWPYEEWMRLINVALSRARHFVLLLASEQEMQEPYLRPLRELFSPYVFQSRRPAGWHPITRTRQPPLKLDVPGMPELLGHQLAARKLLRPILSAEQERLCQLEMDGKPRLVRGVAGSGKTLVLAHWLCQFATSSRHEEQRIWVVYGNRSLGPLLERHLSRAWDELNLASDGLRNPLFPWERVKLCHVRDLLQMMLEKVGSRRKIKKYDYDEAASVVLQTAEKRGAPIEPICDALFLDEAQDMGPETLRLLSAIVKQHDPDDANSKPMMIFYDNAQNIYDRETPVWSEYGLDMRGRSTVMKESFRATRQIAEFALNVAYTLLPPEHDSHHRELLKRGLLEEKEVLGAPWWRVHFNHVDGPSPQLFVFPKFQAQMQAIGQHLATLLQKEKVKPKDIKILYMTDWCKNSLSRVVRPLLEELGVALEFQTSVRFREDENTIIATTPHSFKGYDAEIVILAGANYFADRHGEVRAQALYVAMTRARSLLLIFGSKSTKNTPGDKLLGVIERCLSQLHHVEESSPTETNQLAV